MTKKEVCVWKRKKDKIFRVGALGKGAKIRNRNTTFNFLKKKWNINEENTGHNCNLFTVDYVPLFGCPLNIFLSFTISMIFWCPTISWIPCFQKIKKCEYRTNGFCILLLNVLVFHKFTLYMVMVTDIVDKFINFSWICIFFPWVCKLFALRILASNSKRWYKCCSYWEETFADTINGMKRTLTLWPLAYVL